jgi:hypothetical protein
MLDVQNGDTSRKCSAPAAIPTPSDCINVGEFTSALIVDGLTAGPFCFGESSESSIDAEMGKSPINKECDARVSCDLANVDSLCKQDITQVISNPTVSPFVATCDIAATTSAAISSTRPHVASSTLQPPVLTTTTMTTAAQTPVPAPIITTTTTTIPPPSPTTCSANPVIGPGTECDVATAPTICSGPQIAQCAFVVTSSGVRGNYVFTNCAAGTACRLANGVAVCDFISNDCSAAPPVASSVIVPLPSNTPSPISSSVVVPIPSNTVEPVTRSPLPPTTTSSPSTTPGSPSNVYPCIVGYSLNKCAGTGIKVCVYTGTQSGYTGRFIYAECPDGLECSMGLGYPVCDIPGRSPTIDPNNAACDVISALPISTPFVVTEPPAWSAPEEFISEDSNAGNPTVEESTSLPIPVVPIVESPSWSLSDQLGKEEPITEKNVETPNTDIGDDITDEDILIDRSDSIPDIDSNLDADADCTTVVNNKDSAPTLTSFEPKSTIDAVTDDILVSELTSPNYAAEKTLDVVLTETIVPSEVITDSEVTTPYS